MVLGCVSLTLATICIGVRKFFAGLSACFEWFRGRVYLPRPRVFESREARKAYKDKLKLRSGHVDMTFNVPAVADSEDPADAASREKLSRLKSKVTSL
jgi:hypothetical protein